MMENLGPIQTGLVVFGVLCAGFYLAKKILSWLFLLFADIAVKEIIKLDRADRAKGEEGLLSLAARLSEKEMKEIKGYGE